MAAAFTAALPSTLLGSPATATALQEQPLASVQLLRRGVVVGVGRRVDGLAVVWLARRRRGRFRGRGLPGCSLDARPLASRSSRLQMPGRHTAPRGRHRRPRFRPRLGPPRRTRRRLGRRLPAPCTTSTSTSTSTNTSTSPGSPAEGLPCKLRLRSGSSPPLDQGCGILPSLLRRVRFAGQHHPPRRRLGTDGVGWRAKRLAASLQHAVHTLRRGREVRLLARVRRRRLEARLRRRQRRRRDELHLPHRHAAERHAGKVDLLAGAPERVFHGRDGQRSGRVLTRGRLGVVVAMDWRRTAGRRGKHAGQLTGRHEGWLPRRLGSGLATSGGIAAMAAAVTHWQRRGVPRRDLLVDFGRRHGRVATRVHVVHVAPRVHHGL